MLVRLLRLLPNCDIDAKTAKEVYVKAWQGVTKMLQKATFQLSILGPLTHEHRKEVDDALAEFALEMKDYITEYNLYPRGEKEMIKEDVRKGKDGFYYCKDGYYRNLDKYLYQKWHDDKHSHRGPVVGMQGQIPEYGLANEIVTRLGMGEDGSFKPSVNYFEIKPETVSVVNIVKMGTVAEVNIQYETIAYYWNGIVYPSRGPANGFILFVKRNGKWKYAASGSAIPVKRETENPWEEQWTWKSWLEYIRDKL